MSTTFSSWRFDCVVCRRCVSIHLLPVCVEIVVGCTHTHTHALAQTVHATKPTHTDAVITDTHNTAVQSCACFAYALILRTRFCCCATHLIDAKKQTHTHTPALGARTRTQQQHRCGTTTHTPSRAQVEESRAHQQPTHAHTSTAIHLRLSEERQSGRALSAWKEYE